MGSLIDSLLLLRDHLVLALIAAVLFAAGLGTSLPVTRHNARWLMAFPLWIVRKVFGIIGPGFPPLRVFLLIFAFNTIAIFLYMLSGVLIVVPAAIAFLTGVNLGVIVLKAGEIELPSGERPLEAASDPDEEVEVAPWVSLCTLAVLVLELPSFWVSVGMGIRMGRELSRNYSLANLASLLEPRVAAYWTVIVPALLLSAIAETAAIRGHIGARPVESHGLPPESGTADSSGSSGLSDQSDGAADQGTEDEAEEEEAP